MQRWEQLSEKFAVLSTREKVIIMLCGLVSIFFILLTFLIEPELERKESEARNLEEEKKLVTRLEQEEKLLQMELEADTGKALQKKYLALLDEKEKVALQLSDFVSNLISPSDMAQLLEIVLDSSTGLKLESLQSLPAEPVWSRGSDYARYYIHPVRLELTGKYFDIQAYLLALESMEVKYFWRSFKYQVEEYPKARLELVVYTIGTKREFIGG